MTDERIREALQSEADEAPDAGDLWARTTRRIRRRRLRRWSSAAAVLLIAVAVGGGVFAVLDERREVVLGQPRVPDGWADIVVSDAVLSVPPDWQVVDLTDVSPEEAEPDVEEPVLEDGEAEPAPEPAPCPAINPDRPVLIHSRQGLPDGCPEDPEAFTGLAVVPLDGPAPRVLMRAVLEAGERIQVGGVPARAVDAALVTSSATADPDGIAAAGATTLVTPGIGVHVEVRAGAHAEVVEAVLETLRPRDTFHTEAVLHTVGVYDAEPGAGHEREHVGWAIDPEGRFHRWFHEPIDPQAQAGARFWPAATANRFGGLVHTDEQIRVVAARPGDDAPSVFTVPEEVSADAVTWSPDGEAIAWLVPDPEPRLVVADWGDPDRLADGAAPERIEVAVTGLPDPESQGHLALAWEEDDRGEHLIVYYRPEDTHIAEVRRDNGRLKLHEPLTLGRRASRRRTPRAAIRAITGRDVTNLGAAIG